VLPALLIRKIGVRGTVLAGVAVMAGGLACLSRVHALPIYFLGTALCGIGFQMAALIPGTHVLSAIFKQRALPFGIYFTSAPWAGWPGVDGGQPSRRDPRRLAALLALQAVLVGLVGLVCALAVGGPRWLERAGAALDRVLDAEAKARNASGTARPASITPTTSGASATPSAPPSSWCCWRPISATCWPGSPPPA